jgi:hypothetical protein
MDIPHSKIYEKFLNFLKVANLILINKISRHSYETSDGQMRYEYGYFQERAEGAMRVLNVRGFYGFNDDKGKRHFVRYFANEKGFLFHEGEPYFDSSLQGIPTVENTLFDEDAKRHRTSS